MVVSNLSIIPCIEYILLKLMSLRGAGDDAAICLEIAYKSAVDYRATDLSTTHAFVGCGEVRTASPMEGIENVQVY